MSHAYHDALPGYDPHQLLVDGCAECEERGGNIYIALSHMDADRFARAWQRAALFNRLETEGQVVGTISDAERPLLDVLWAIIVQLERRGLPIPQMPPAGPVHDLSRPDLSQLTAPQRLCLQVALSDLADHIDEEGWIEYLRRHRPGQFDEDRKEQADGTMRDEGMERLREVQQARIDLLAVLGS